MRSARTVEKHFDKVADSYDLGKRRYSFYYSNLKKILGGLIGKNKNVFEFGCGTGELLDYLKPKHGYGYDISSRMIFLANRKYGTNKNIIFSTRLPKSKFEYIFMSDVIEHLEKPQSVFEQISKLMNKNSRFIITMANPIWEPLLMIWEKLGLKMKEGPHHRAGIKECRLWFKNAGMKIIKHDYKLLIPIKIPLITKFANNYLEKYFRRLAFVEYFVVVKP